MSTVRIPAKQRFVLDGATWGDYTRWLKVFDERRHVRLTYDRGILEVVTLSHEHERGAYILGLLISLWGAGRGVAIRGGRTTTFRRRDKDRGFEPDNCYWIAHEAQVRGLTRIDLRRDPPPDLAVEIDVTHSSVPRMPIYASLGVPEVWRLQNKGLSFNLLQSDESYAVIAVSKALSPLTPGDLTPFLTMSRKLDDSTIIQKFTAWVRKFRPTTP
jgi:Uma2 family endonuclease